MQTAVLDSFVAFAGCTLSFSSREKWVLYTLTVNWGMEDICTWINCILTTLRQLRISSEKSRHEIFLFVPYKLSLALFFIPYNYCDPMAGYQGELIIIKSERAESFSYGGRGQEIRWNILFVLSSYPFALSTATWKWVTRIMIEALVTEGNCLAFQSLSYSHSPFAVNLKSLYQLGHLVAFCHSWSITRNEMHWKKIKIGTAWQIPLWFCFP